MRKFDYSLEDGLLLANLINIPEGIYSLKTSSEIEKNGF